MSAGRAGLAALHLGLRHALRRECARSFSGVRSRLPPIEDRLGDIRREIAEADEAGEVGPADTFLLGKCSKGDAFALGECRVEPARPEKQLYQSRIGFRGGKRIGAVDHHSDLPPGAAQPHRYGQKLGFLGVGALR
jgi:hypothetical protein